MDMVRGRLPNTISDSSRATQLKMKTRSTAFKKGDKNDQYCITKYFKASPIQLSTTETVNFDLTPTSKCYNQDYFESRFNEGLIAAFAKSPFNHKTEPAVKIGSPLHRIELNSNLFDSQKNVPTEHKLTDFFPIRRSERKTKKIVQEEKQKDLEELLRSGLEDGLAIHTFFDKGRGVVATKPFNRGDFVVEYSGELLDMVQAKRREENYAQDTTTGCYMYYFKHQNRQYCVDATAESGRLGRLINHSRNGNLITRTVVVDTLPRLVFIAKDSISVNDELSYDYGDRSKESLKHHPWLAY